MKKISIILTFVALLICNNANAVELSDISNHWASESIYRLIEANSINGYEDNTFRPNNNITIAEFLKILVQYTDYKKVLEGERWPDWYINTAKYYEFIQENEFSNYDNFITRFEVARILGRFIWINDVEEQNISLKDTADNDVIKLASLGVINGYEDNTFRGDNAISRAEAAAIICRAMKSRRELVANKKYDISDAEKLTNIGRIASYDSDYRNRYEIKNGKIYFFDDGRYAPLDGYVIKDNNIENKKIINLIASLIQEDAYVGVSYIPDNITYDQVIIEYGRREGYVYNHSYAFSFIFYPDKQFELRKSSMNNELSEKCFMKISVARMWKDAIDMKNGKYAEEFNNEKLLKSLCVIFDDKTARNIFDYIQEWIPKLYEEGIGNKFVEVKKFGKYEINLYTTGNSRVEIYISK